MKRCTPDEHGYCDCRPPCSGALVSDLLGPTDGDWRPWEFRLPADVLDAAKISPPTSPRRTT